LTYYLITTIRHTVIMAMNNLATIMKEETTSKQLTKLMKELVEMITALEETRKKLREKIEEVCGNRSHGQ
jgi:hypothetical protein